MIFSGRESKVPLPTDRTENWAIKGGKKGHNLEVTVGLVLCVHKIVGDPGLGIFGSALSTSMLYGIGIPGKPRF